MLLTAIFHWYQLDPQCKIVAKIGDDDFFWSLI
jgi:hypothetical protein